MNLKKILLGSLAVVALTASLAPVNAALSDTDTEFKSALSWAYENGLTKYNTEAAFNPYANITREQAFKFLASYTVTNLCEVTSSEDAACDFSDINSGDYSLKEYVMLACELGLVRGTAGKVLPTSNLTRAEAFTILSRAMSANAGEDAPAEDGNPWYANHFKAMQDAGITKETNVEAQTRSISRYELLLVLYRAKMDNAECSDTDVSDLLDELFGDDTTTTGDDTTEEVVTESNGTAMAKLSSDTPNGATVPGGVSVKTASFTITADWEDVVLNGITLQRMGLGDTSTVKNFSVFANWDVVSKSKTFNSDKQGVVSFNPAVTVKKGTTVTIDVVTTVGTVSSSTNEEFAIALVDFSTNGKETVSNLPLTANTFRIGGVDGAKVKVTRDGNISDVNLGDTGVEVAKIQLDNNSNNTVKITQITIKDDQKNADEDLKNFVLKHKGTTIATTAMANGKYVTFTLTTPLTILKNESQDLRVYADVIAGAGDIIDFTIDQEIYVIGTDDQYGYGIATDISSYTSSDPFVVLAGDLTLSENRLPSTKARQNQKDVVLADFGLFTKSGKDLSLENIKFNITPALAGVTHLSNIFENVQLQVISNWTTKTFDLDETTSGSPYSVSDTDLGVFLAANANTQIKLIADTVSVFPAGVTGVNITTTLATASTSDFKVIENNDDKVVTNIVPSSIAFDTITFVNSTVALSKLSLGDVSIVRWATNVDGIKFQIKPDDVSNVFLNSLSVMGTVTSGASATCAFQSSLISAVKLWKQTSATSGGWTLVEEKGGTKISAGVIVFDSFAEIEIMKSVAQNFLVTVDVTDDNNLAGCEFNTKISAAQVDDDDNKALIVSTLPSVSGRNIKVTGAWSLTTSAISATDSKVSSAKHIVGWTTSDYLARFDLTAVNEAMDLNDITIVVSWAVANFSNNVTEVVLYNAAGTELSRQAVVNNSTVVFENLNWVTVDQWSTTLYVKVLTQGIGLNQWTTTTMWDVNIALIVDEAQGKSSWVKVSTLATQYSQTFDVIPAKISNIEFVNSYAGNSVITSFNTVNGYNNANIAILKITTDNWNNLTTAGTTLDVVLDTIQFNLPAGVTSGTIERLGNGTVTPISLVSGLATFPTIDSNSSISKSTTAYYLIKGNIAGGTPNFNVSINGLDSGSFVYETNEAAYGSVAKALIGASSVNAATIQSSN